ncbi:hypothetical protein ASPSYDRAFT_1165328 [Aspergillus sydowii CBS 593.65]|uniref:Uncharacterized protein n=1 Tax=Aspergillus sydowii CBS 593.65 TaxID=1036612 RepID=A0A1L9T0Q1_9EURO|nr:uncharacterized protein ASPSYDRAFT_1165328 [Aspergillus sydowii CBS 593.65]OJJ52873.1 hypothetical protein ASPSYDRAFT_1165328 [Aspergillus sydowii CBS 593.65]
MTQVMSPHVLLIDYSPLAVFLLCLHETQNCTDGEKILLHLNTISFLLQNCLYYEGSNNILRAFIFEVFCYSRDRSYSLAKHIISSPHRQSMALSTRGILGAHRSSLP